MQNNCSERVANICRLPIERIEEQQARLAKTIYDNVVRSINAQTYATANNIAARALASSLQTRVRAVELIQRGQVDDLIKRATDLAAAPQTQALLQRADEVTYVPESDVFEAFVAFPEDLPDDVQVEWIVQLDRATLEFLFWLLFHLTGILSPAFGVAAAVSDHEINVEDMGVVLSGLHVMLAYVLIALNQKEK